MGRIEATELESFVRSLVESWDAPPDVAASLAGADLTGHGSHDVRRLATLSPDMLAGGALVPDARPDVDDGGTVDALASVADERGVAVPAGFD